MAIRIRPKDGEKHLEQDAALAVKLASTRPWIVSGLALGNGTGLNAEIGAGLAWIAGYVVELDAAVAATCAASDTNHIFLELAIDGNDLVTGLNVVVNTTDTPPIGPSVKLGTATTNGSAVTGTATTGRSPEVQVEPIPQAAEDISYDNTVSGMAATDVKAALDELAARPASAGWSGVTGRSSDLSKNNTTFEALVSFTAEANKTYLVECIYMVVNAAGGNKLQVTVPAAGAADLSINTLRTDGTFNTSTIQCLIDVAAASSQNLNGSTATRQLVTVQGIVTTGANAGTVAFEVAQQSASGTSVFKAGSSLKWKDIT